MSDLDYAPEKVEAIQATIQGQNPYVPQGSLLTGWVLLAEFATPDGDQSLIELTSDGLKGWQKTGYLYSAIEGDFDDGEED